MSRVSHTNQLLLPAVTSRCRLQLRMCMALGKGADCCAALVNAIHVVRSRQDVAHVKIELLKRLRKASDWLVSTFCPPPQRPQLVDLVETCEYATSLRVMPASAFNFESNDYFLLQTALKTLMVIHRLMRESNDHWLLEVTALPIANVMSS